MVYQTTPRPLDIVQCAVGRLLMFGITAIVHYVIIVIIIAMMNYYYYYYNYYC